MIITVHGGWGETAFPALPWLLHFILFFIFRNTIQYYFIFFTTDYSYFMFSSDLFCIADWKYLIFFQVFDITDCSYLYTSPWHRTETYDLKCKNQRSRHFMHALGVQERLSNDELSGIEVLKAGCFVTQKGFSHKAQWNYQYDLFSPVRCQYQITTPDGE